MPVGVRVADSPRVLMKINRPDCVAAIWERQPLASFQAWLDALDPKVLPRARLILRPDAVEGAIAHLWQQAGTPECPERDMLQGDIAALAHMFADVTSTEYVRFRLGVLNGELPAGVSFGAANVRLVCAYSGPEMRLGQATGENGDEVAISPGVPVVARSYRRAEHPHGGVPYLATSPTTGNVTRFVLTLDPVWDAEGTRAGKTVTYH